MSELKPCDWCGVEGTPEVDEDNINYTVACLNRECPVHVRTRNFKTRAEAIAAWNTRTPDTVNVLRFVRMAILMVTQFSEVVPPQLIDALEAIHNQLRSAGIPDSEWFMEPTEYTRLKGGTNG
jgi:hypothetical protein